MIVTNDRTARGLSWVAALLCAHYIGWGFYQLKWQIPVFAQLLVGLGAELPAATRLVIDLSNHAFPLSILLILLVIGKELLLRDIVIRLETTFIVFLSVAWAFDFATTALLLPVVHIMGKTHP
jgi:hypothetical protein